MGLFWRQATSRAALWTAIVTIPVGIGIRAIFPEMPFILRMGYVFIILSFVATIISFMDRRGRMEREVVMTPRSRNIVNTGWLFIGLAIMSLVAGIFLIVPFRYLGIESIFMLATLFAFLGVILILNVKMNYVYKKSYDTNPEVYRTSPVFTAGAIGITIIIVLLYYFFW